jgi:CRISPR system Cascade subunit CasE
MAYLSRVWLNPQRTTAQRFLQNPHVAHAAILAGISRQPVDQRVLWRLGPDPGTAHRLELLILTQTRPSWEHLVEQAGWPSSDEPEAITRPYEPLLNQIMLGRQFAFRLKANPVSSTKHPDAPSRVQKERIAAQARPRGVRVPQRTAAHQLDWLTARINQWGFTIAAGEAGLPAVRLTARDRLSFRKSGASAGPVVLQTATFDGIVEITDPDAARRSLLHGVGPAKAYGLGLLTLAPTIPTAQT